MDVMQARGELNVVMRLCLPAAAREKTMAGSGGVVRL